MFDIDALFDGHKIDLVRDSENSCDSKEWHELKYFRCLMTSSTAKLSHQFWLTREQGVFAAA